MAADGAIVLACSVGLGAFIALTVLRGDPTWGSSAMVAAPVVLTTLAVLPCFLAPVKVCRLGTTRFES